MQNNINTHNFFRFFLFILFLVYFSQGLIYKSGALLSKVSLLLIILISGIYFLKTLLVKERKNQFYWAWSLLLTLNTFGFLLTMKFSALYTDMFKSILICSLSFYPFYYFTKNNVIKRQHFIIFFYLMLAITVLQYFRTTKQLVYISDQEFVVNSISYSFVALIPFVFLIKKNKIISTVLFSIILYFVIMGNKRGAIIVSIVGILTYIYYQISILEKKSRVKGYVGVFFLILSILYFTYSTFNKNEYIIKRMSSIYYGDSSGRDIIFTRIFNSWSNSENLGNLIFGYGFAGSLQLTGGSYAHNDWLELLSNFGLIGVLIYLFVFISAIKVVQRNNVVGDKKILLFSIVLMWFTTTLFSMWYSSIVIAMQSMLLGYIFGTNRLTTKDLLL